MNPQYAYQYLVGRGVAPAVAAGIVDNLQVESGGFDPAVLAGTRRGDQGSAAYVQQLRGPRLANFERFAAASGRSPGDIEAQLDFILEEMRPGSPYADGIAAKNRDAIMSAPTREAAGRSFAQHYERPNPATIDKRINSAPLDGVKNPPKPAPRPDMLPAEKGKGLANLAPNGLRFRNAGQENITQDLRDVLTGTQADMGRELPINSGYRSPTHNRRVRGAKDSFHVQGKAADIDMTGLTPVQRQKLVTELTQRGAGGLITYTQSPDMLHVDMRRRPDGENPWFMHDKSNANMGRAPDWFREAQANGGITLPREAPLPFQPGDAQPSPAPMIADAAPMLPPTYDAMSAPNSAPMDPVVAQAPVLPQVQQASAVPAPAVGTQPAPPLVNRGFVPALPATPIQTPAPAVAAAPAITPAAPAITPAAPAMAGGMSGLGSMLSGLVSALAAGSQASAAAAAQANEQWMENYAKTLGDPQRAIANMPRDMPGRELAAGSGAAVNPILPGAPQSADEILASLFGRPSSRVYG